ncbi:MAG: ribonuclease E inhibitor RraB [Planctomycetaceae bacterium]
MKFPDDTNGDIFRMMERDGFDFTSEHVVDFHAVFATEEEADRIAHLYVADHKAGEKFTNIETQPFEEGGMELTLSKRMLVTYEAVSAFEARLAERVSQVNGYLDGWGVLQS